MDYAGRRALVQLEELRGRVPFVPIVRYLEARARAATGKAAGRAGDRSRRCDGGLLRRRLAVARRVLSSLLILAERCSWWNWVRLNRCPRCKIRCDLSLTVWRFEN